MKETGSKPASDKGQAVETSKDNSTALSEEELKQVSGGAIGRVKRWADSVAQRRVPLVQLEALSGVNG